jgi:hypothetical protein
MGLDHSRHQNYPRYPQHNPKSGLVHLKSIGRGWNQKKHTTAGIRWWSPTQLLICRSEAYVWQSGRDAQFIFSLWSYVPAKLLISIIYGTNDRFSSAFMKTVLWERGANRSILACDIDTEVVKNEFGLKTLSKRSC